MARPKSTTPNKQRLNLTVSAKARLELEQISQILGKSISEWVEEQASKEVKKLQKKTGIELPDVNQIKFE